MAQTGQNGGLYAVNPENGFFGVAPGTNAKSNPNALASTSRDTISPTSCRISTTTPSGGRVSEKLLKTLSIGKDSPGTRIAA